MTHERNYLIRHHLNVIFHLFPQQVPTFESASKVCPLKVGFVGSQMMLNNENMMNNFIKKRRLGQLKTADRRQFNHIIGKLIESRNIIQVQKFTFLAEEEQEHHRRGLLAIDLNSQHLLLGGSSRTDKYFIRLIDIKQARKSNKFHELRLTRTRRLYRIQWSPSGNETYSACTDNELRVIDTRKQMIRFQWTNGDRKTTWSDWHPWETNVFATCDKKKINVVDIRANSINWASHGASEWNPFWPTCCVWSNRNENYLFVGQLHGFISLFDKRNLAKPLGAMTLVPRYRQDYDIRLDDLQMNHDYLFAHSRWDDGVCQWRVEEGERLEFVRRYRNPYCRHGARCSRCQTGSSLFRCQYHLTDTHVFIPQGSLMTRTNSQDQDVAHMGNVYDIQTGEMVNSMQSLERVDLDENHIIDDESDPWDYIYENDRYPAGHLQRVDVIVGTSDHLAERRLYSLKETSLSTFQIDLWTYSCPLNCQSQNLPAHSIKLTRGGRIRC